MTTATIVKAERYIFRCVSKRTACKHTWAYDYEPHTSDSKWGPVTHNYRTTTDGTKVYVGDDLHQPRCPKCNSNAVTFVHVNGKVTDHVCDARCMNAKGQDCECQCGGENHGKSYLGI